MARSEFTHSLVGLILVAAGCSCDSDGAAASSGSPDGSGAGGVGASSSSNGPTPTGAGAQAGHGASSSSGGAGAGGGEMGDPGWVDTTWSPCPAMQVATHPAAVAPKIAWEPCNTGVEGCEQLAGYSEQQLIFATGVLHRADGRWMSAALTNKGEAQSWRLLFAPDGTVAQAYWDPHAAPCVQGVLLPLEDEVLFEAQLEGPNTGAFVSLGYGGELLETFDFKDEVQGGGRAGRHVAVYERFGGMQSRIVDRTGETTTLVAMRDAQVIDDRVYGREPTVLVEDVAGIRWSRELGEQTLVDQPGLSVRCMGSDGTTLRWVSLPTGSDLATTPAQLWSSPDVDDPSELSPSYVGELLPSFGHCFIRGNQLVATTREGVDDTIHVISLPSMQTKSFLVGGPLWSFQEVNDEYVYFSNRGRPKKQKL